MDYLQLRYFVVVAECMNFTKAAERLYITQPGLTRHISNLEDSLGTTLFDRSKRSISLTPAGEALLKEAYPILKNHERVVAKIGQFNTCPEAKLSVGYGGWLEPTYFRGFIQDFVASEVGHNIHIKKGSFLENMNRLNNQDLDVILSFFSGYECLNGMCHEHLAPVYTVLITTPNHPLASQNSVSLNELIREPIVALTRDSNPFAIDIFHTLFTSRGIVPNMRYYADNRDDYFTMLEAGAGVGISCTLYPTMDPGNTNLKFTLVHDHIMFEYLAIWREDVSNPHILRFCNEVKRYIKQNDNPIFSY
jgi:DNA-binding transcriptional LysR family regulator